MLIDSRNEFADNVVGTSAASTTTVRGNQIDLGAAGEDQQGGGDNPLYLVITVDTAFVSANNNPSSFELVSDSVATLDSSPTVHLATRDYLPADLTLGAKFVFALPSMADAERYLGIRQVVGAGASGITAGNFSAFLTRDAGSWKAYPDSPNVV